MLTKSLLSKPCSLGILLLTVIIASTAFSQDRVETAEGTLEGVYRQETNVRSFKGVPFAAPPVGDLRWQPPQPAKPWEGVRRADKFGARAMQRPVFGDMNFRSDGMSEDCLFLNVWTPGKARAEPLPVLVYFYGGGLIAGDASEGRYDGENMAGKGMVVVTVNYRLNVFGFFAHPELTKESPHHASGNYGFLDQQAALAWVQRNIAAFGGDPKRVTIGGESAGSFSVSAHLASPLSKDLLAGAIGESGSILGLPIAVLPLAEGEADGVRFAADLGSGDAPSLAALRAMPAEALLAATAKGPLIRFKPTVDGYFFPQDPAAIYRAGEQAHVPLLAGVNSEENGYANLLEKAAPTVENYQAALRRLYPDDADETFHWYPASNDAEVRDAARELASDRFISFGTWHWMDLASKTGGQPTYYYVYTHPRPPMRPEMGDDAVAGLAGGVVKDAKAKREQRPARGAVHSAEIEYALGTLGENKVYAWTPADEEVSRQLQGYFVNFIKTGQPNGEGLPEWPKFSTGERLVIDLKPHAEKNDALRARYEFFERVLAAKTKIR